MYASILLVVSVRLMMAVQAQCRGGTAVGDFVLDLKVLSQRGLFDALPKDVFAQVRDTVRGE